MFGKALFPQAALRAFRTSLWRTKMSQDTQLQQRVLAELNWEPSVPAGHIGVTAKDGIVTLSGHVESYANKHAAETVARRVRGVLGVVEEIVVNCPFTSNAAMRTLPLLPSNVWLGTSRCHGIASK